ncbi:MAG: 3-isopropylmalate dehydrogenase [Rhodospirillaceae bacterium]|nr:3-isopropylmalate dehydrogenase [Rhodospirillaceae bacterium]|tara:strand:+ start:3896 stop:5005 length:1110 start_codon:yes stop_codon:yes gene_type:complete
MTANKKLLMLPGDGIGPEVSAVVSRVIDWFAKRRQVSFDVSDGLVGGASYDKHGTPLTDETLADAMTADAVLFGAIGGPKWDTIDFSLRPERALLKLRKEMGLFANLRPAVVFPALADASSLKPELVSGLDLMIVRELTGGIYFGEPRGIEDLGWGERRGFNTLEYTTKEIRRVGRVAFELARKRGNRVCSVDKSNVLESTLLWREEMTKLGEKEFPDVELSHMLADNAAMQLVRDPKQFDVMVTTNMFGDILSDCAAMLTGSLGMLPSASLGAEENGRIPALYEPVHGSAPDIAGKDMANPVAMLSSFSMMLRYSFDLQEDADLIDNAISALLSSGLRTADIMQEGKAKVSTSVLTDAMIRELDKQAA